MPEARNILWWEFAPAIIRGAAVGYLFGVFLVSAVLSFEMGLDHAVLALPFAASFWFILALPSFALAAAIAYRGQPVSLPQVLLLHTLLLTVMAGWLLPLLAPLFAMMTGLAFWLAELGWTWRVAPTSTPPDYRA